MVTRRRRRTRRHRQNRIVRRILTIVALTVCVGALSAFALRFFVPSLFQSRLSAPPLDSVEPGNARSATMNQVLSDAQARPVYPYSVVPGGVEDVKELKWAAEHDPVVAAHYAGFDYDHAQVVRVTLARTVYLSYRIGNHIYWTRRRIALHKGEKLITDGKITARTRCANQVKETPQQQAAPVEPAPQKFDEPVRAGTGTAMQTPPVAFESALLNRPEAPGLGAAQPLSLYDPFVGGGFISIAPPPLPAGLCTPTKKKSTGANDDAETGTGIGKKKRPGPCGGGAGSLSPVPEPGTWVLFISGLAAIFWFRRQRLAPG